MILLRKYKEKAVKLLPLVAAVGLILLALRNESILVPPLAFIVTGLTLIGFTMPNFIDEILGSGGHTLWTPIGIIVFSIIGFNLIFSSGMYAAMTTSYWCVIQPCMPMMFVPGALVLGVFAHFTGHFLNKEKLRLF